MSKGARRKREAIAIAKHARLVLPKPQPKRGYSTYADATRTHNPRNVEQTERTEPEPAVAEQRVAPTARPASRPPKRKA